MYINSKEETNKYFSFEKKIGNIEFEIKVRDKDDSLQIIRLDMNMTKMKKKQKKYFSYAKYLLRGPIGYKYIKLFIAESIFYRMRGSYMFS